MIGAEYPYAEKHVSGSEDGDTVGWLWHATSEYSVWCGEISRARFDEMGPVSKEAMRDDLGWALILYAKHRSVVLGRALDEYSGQDLAQTIAFGIATAPSLAEQLLEQGNE